MITRATQIDAGFDTKVLADMMATLDRFTDSEIPVSSGSSAAELRALCVGWRSRAVLRISAAAMIIAADRNVNATTGETALTAAFAT